MIVYTSVTKSYIPKARVLAESVKQFHPDWKFILLLSDSIPDKFDLSRENFDEILTLEQLPLQNRKAWTFGHSVVELCTAVKGVAAEFIAEKYHDEKIMYLDPDIKVFNSLEPLNQLLDIYDILLTPHLLDVENTLDAIKDNEISALKHGIYNLGFFAVRTSGQGLDFIRWWAKRLFHFCTNDIPNGLFTDQRWCDLAPCFFDKLHIVRDRGYNVATWNIAFRPLSRSSNGSLFAGSTLLRFYHFTGYDSGAGFGMLKKYATDQDIANEIWEGYGADLKRADHGKSDFSTWIYDRYDNGETIPLEARRLYRSREDLIVSFPDPYAVVEPSFKNWYAIHQLTLSGNIPADPLNSPNMGRITWIRKFSNSVQKRKKKYFGRTKS
jgi:hypothetical protein